MHISNNKNFSPQFKAIKVANTLNKIKGVTTEIEIYQLTKEDKNFLQKLENRISIKKLCPNLKDEIQQRWQQVFNYCIQEAKESFNKTFITISDGIPCGILTLFEDCGKNLEFLGISSIPNQFGKKVNFGGQTLLYQLFKEAEKEGKGIQLQAIHNGPVDVVKKYKDLGFITIGASEKYTDMECNRYKVKEQLNKFKELIVYSPKKGEKTNLEQFLD